MNKIISLESKQQQSVMSLNIYLLHIIRERLHYYLSKKKNLCCEIRARRDFSLFRFRVTKCKNVAAGD